MMLYHGSNTAIDHINLSLSKRAKDFGHSFYLSEDLEQAQKMAELTAFRTGSGVPTVTAFAFNEQILNQSMLNIKVFNGYTEDWANFIALNRRGC